MLNGKKDGRYLEIGSADPYHGSNTALLEELGWTGLSLEILEREVEKFKEHRTNEVILCDATKYDYQSLVGDFDYLQVDCEPPATTYYILTKIPFDKIKFSVITYEHDHYTDMDSVYREKSRELLKKISLFPILSKALNVSELYVLCEKGVNKITGLFAPSVSLITALVIFVTAKPSAASGPTCLQMVPSLTNNC